MPILDYQPRPRGLRRRKAWLWVVLALAAAAVYPAWRWGPAAWGRTQLVSPCSWDFSDVRFNGAKRTHPDLAYIPNRDRPPFMRTSQVRFFAGQADSADESRFTFRYEMNGGAGTIEGRLVEDEAAPVPGPRPRYYVHLNMLDGPGLQDPALPPATTQASRPPGG